MGKRVVFFFHGSMINKVTFQRFYWLYWFITLVSPYGPGVMDGPGFTGEFLPGTDSPDMVWKPGDVLLRSAYDELSMMAEIIP